MKEFEQEDTYYAIEDLDLRPRTYAVLKRSGINSKNELLRLSLHELSEFRNMGRKDLQLILEALVPSWIGGSVYTLLRDDVKRNTSLQQLLVILTEPFEQ